MYGSRRVPVWHCIGGAAVGLGLLSLSLVPAAARQHQGLVSITARSNVDVRDWSARVDGMRRAGDLRVRSTTADTVVRGRNHQRLDQFHRGVRVFGADVAEQMIGGQVISVFGNVYANINIDPSPEIGAERAREIVEADAGVELGAALDPELVILPRGNDAYLLTWRLKAALDNDIRAYFVDARTGTIAFEYSDLQTQSAVGRGQGVLGDSKKISVQPSGGQYMAKDMLRPPSLTTYDMQGNHQRVISFLNGSINLGNSDIASDSDNNWTDTAVTDAHVYAGWTYDYYFKRFDRRGLNNANRAVQVLVHPIRRVDVFTLFDQFSEFYTNAFYAGNGVVVFGEGLPPNTTLGGQSWDFVSGALDIVAHELTHGVTEFSSNLIYQNESGALNEAFSDIIGTSAEFFFQPPGSGNLRADYAIGEDVVRVGGIRSMSDPQSMGDPDHYSRRFLGTADNGGVHINSGIPNHVFYLAIEGGTNRTSGISVQGVGASNREQIEKVFYRAFTQMLPANATFAVARAATIQSARDLFGNNSAAERAVTQAWTACGVN
jgi:bacillolysin